MAVITLFSGIFCNEAAVVQQVGENSKLETITDDQVLDNASRLSGIHKLKIKKAFSANVSVFNQFTHEQECSIAYLRLALAQAIDQMPDPEALVVSGYTGLLIPKTLHPALRVCLMAETRFRLALAQKEQGGSPEEALEIIRQEDLDRAVWTDRLFSKKDPWDPGLYDLVLPMDKHDPGRASDLIQERLKALTPTSDSRLGKKDFLLAAQTEVTLVHSGHHVQVQAQKGEVILTILKKVPMLSPLEEELKLIAGKVSGVVSVEIHVEPADSLAPAYRKQNFELPAKVLLVDDEREFVQTLSERLQMRDMGCVVAYEGGSALDLVQTDAPEVMVIDLKMPGMDGMEVLRQVKQTRPEIQVIILTGHGSERDRKTCMDLGAYAYMQKPVDINLLSETLKKAHEQVKILEKKGV